MFILIIFTLSRQRSRRRGWSCGLRGGGGGGGEEMGRQEKQVSLV